MKKFFLPVDGSLHSTYAMQYMAMMAPILQDADYLLFYVQPTISDYLIEESKTDTSAMKKLKQLKEKNETLGNDILQRRKKDLMNLKVPEEKIQMLTQPRREGAARDILWEAEKVLADAIIIGRRGLSKIQDTFLGSTSKNVIEHSAGIPVWMVNGEVTSKNILLAVDGSVDSVKAMDYLLEMIREKPDVDLTLFHVQASLVDSCGVDFTETEAPGEGEASVGRIIEKADRQCIDNFVSTARSKLKQKGLEQDRVKVRTQPAKVNIGKAIAEEFRSGDYGSLVVGKRGINKRFFMGSVSHYLLTHLDSGALWVIT